MLTNADHIRLLAFEAALDRNRALWAALHRAAALAQGQANTDPQPRASAWESSCQVTQTVRAAFPDGP